MNQYDLNSEEVNLSNSSDSDSDSFNNYSSNDDQDSKENEVNSDSDSDYFDDEDIKYSLNSDHEKSGDSDNSSNVKKELKDIKDDEYNQDSSDEEDVKNTIGNVPIEWYDDFEHIGYDLAGKKLLKTEKPGDELDDFIQKMDNPDYWRTVRDKSTGKKVVLSEEDINIVRSYLKGKESKKDSDTLFDEPFVSETQLHPVTNRPEHKRSFTPSKWERLRVGQLVHAIKMGWIKVTEKKDDNEKVKGPKFYELWSAESDIRKRVRQYIPAPKLAIPGHAESYNPPAEYLFNSEQKKKWEETDPSERLINFVPQKYDCLRHVPNYSRFVNERFERCLDLYLCPRQIKMRANMKAEDLLPKLPKPRDLQPFPTTQSIIYRGHSDAVRCITVDPNGLWLASGSEDKSMKIWEISTGYCVQTKYFEGSINSVTWNPQPFKTIIALAVGNQLHIINSHLGSHIFETDELMFNKGEINNTTESRCAWQCVDGRLFIEHPTEIGQIAWQMKGDYFISVLKDTPNSSIMIHHLTKKSTMNPFRKTKGRVQCAKFHPTKPILYVATQQYIRIYDLVKQQLIKKLMSNCKWISSLSIHPGGDNLIIGSYDNRLSWFDTDLSNKPYQTLRHHKRAIRQVVYHSYLPLFASASDDGCVIICHGQVYNDLTINPLLVPVKILKGHVNTKNLGVLDCIFHPIEPWIFSSGADHTIRLYS